MSSVRDLPHLDVSAVDFHADSIDLERARSAFDDAGFIVVRGLMTRYVETMMVEVQEAVSAAHRELSAATLMRYGWSTPSGGIFADRAPPGHPPELHLICVPLTMANSPTMRACAADTRLLGILAPLLGDDVHVIGTGQCMYKEALRGHEAALHQDAIYPGTDGYADVVYAFTYLVPTPVERGCIWVIPYSHRLGLLAHEESGRRAGTLPAPTCDFGDAVPVEGGPGDTVLWKYTIVHGSKPNVTDVPRPTVISRYGRLDRSGRGD
jgi:ectoine hydroxylase-related dioxygenase (phytanoyl-CoA dioxygenase family)